MGTVNTLSTGILICVYLYIFKKAASSASPEANNSHEIVTTSIVSEVALEGTFKLTRRYPIIILVVIAISGLIIPICLAASLVPHMEYDNRQIVAKLSLLLAVLLPALIIFYLYRSSIHEIRVDKKKDIYIKTKNDFEKLQVSQFKYVRFYTYQYTRNYNHITGFVTPTMIVFSNIKNDYIRLFLSTYFPSLKGLIVLPIYKIKSQDGNLKVKPYVLGNLVKKLCKQNGFTTQFFERGIKSDGWLAERKDDSAKFNSL